MSTATVYPSVDTNHMTVDELYQKLREIKARQNTRNPWWSNPQDQRDELEIRFCLNRRQIITGLAVPALGE
jgi:hypothetical protein